jgi:hypothetical protein
MLCSKRQFEKVGCKSLVQFACGRARIQQGVTGVTGAEQTRNLLSASERRIDCITQRGLLSHAGGPRGRIAQTNIYARWPPGGFFSPVPKTVVCETAVRRPMGE